MPRAGKGRADVAGYIEEGHHLVSVLIRSPLLSPPATLLFSPLFMMRLLSSLHIYRELMNRKVQGIPCGQLLG